MGACTSAQIAPTTSAVAGGGRGDGDEIADDKSLIVVLRPPSSSVETVNHHNTGSSNGDTNVGTADADITGRMSTMLATRRGSNSITLFAKSGSNNTTSNSQSQKHQQERIKENLLRRTASDEVQPPPFFVGASGRRRNSVTSGRLTSVVPPSSTAVDNTPGDHHHHDTTDERFTSDDGMEVEGGMRAFAGGAKADATSASTLGSTLSDPNLSATIPTTHSSSASISVPQPPEPASPLFATHPDDSKGEAFGDHPQHPLPQEEHQGEFVDSLLEFEAYGTEEGDEDETSARPHPFSVDHNRDTADGCDRRSPPLDVSPCGEGSTLRRTAAPPRHRLDALDAMDVPGGSRSSDDVSHHLTAATAEFGTVTMDAGFRLSLSSSSRRIAASSSGGGGTGSSGRQFLGRNPFRPSSVSSSPVTSRLQSQHHLPTTGASTGGGSRVNFAPDLFIAYDEDDEVELQKAIAAAAANASVDGQRRESTPHAPHVSSPLLAVSSRASTSSAAGGSTSGRQSGFARAIRRCGTPSLIPATSATGGSLSLPPLDATAAAHPASSAPLVAALLSGAEGVSSSSLATTEVSGSGNSIPRSAASAAGGCGLFTGRVVRVPMPPLDAPDGGGASNSSSRRSSSGGRSHNTINSNGGGAGTNGNSSSSTGTTSAAPTPPSRTMMGSFLRTLLV